MKFKKKTTKPEKIGKVKAHKKSRRQFHNDGMYAGRFSPETYARTVTEAYIVDHVEPARRPFVSRIELPDPRISKTLGVFSDASERRAGQGRRISDPAAVSEQ